MNVARSRLFVHGHMFEGHFTCLMPEPGSRVVFMRKRFFPLARHDCVLAVIPIDGNYVLRGIFVANFANLK